MSEHVLKEFETLREAVEFIKDELKKTDDDRRVYREISLKINPSRVSESMEEDNWNDELFLLYSIDDDDSFFVFESDYDLSCWLKSTAWDNWALWEYKDIEASLNEDVVVWKFLRDIRKEKWATLYRDSKPFINGWSRQRKKIGFEAVPSFKGPTKMHLEKMFQMQAELDRRIIKEKGLEGQDLLPNTYVALITELGEFANEGRWFKHWSENQEPKQPEYNWKPNKDGSNLEWHAENGYKSYPLLEEYVDCLHFFLSIAIKKGWPDELHVSEEIFFGFDEFGFEGGLSGVYLEMQWSLLNSRMFKDEEKKKEHFRSAWGLFLAIGIVGFGFKPEQIEKAYMDKNAVNHKRQQEGY